MTTKQFAHAWLVTIIASLYFLAQFVLQSSIGLMIPDLQRSFGVDIIEISLLSSFYFYSYLLMQIPSGLLTDHFGARRVILLSLSLFIFSIVLFSNAQSIFVAKVARIAMGFCVAPALTCAMWLATRWLPSRYFATAAGIIESLGMIGGVLSYQYFPILFQSYGWRGTTALVALLSCGLLLLCVFTVFDSNTIRSIPLNVEKRSRNHVINGLKNLLQTPQAWLFGCYSGMMFATITAFASFWSVPFLQAKFPNAANLPHQLTAVIFFGVAIGTPLSGFLCSFLRRRLVLTGYSCLALSSTLALLYAPALPIDAYRFLMFAIGFSAGSYVVPFAQIREITPPQSHGVAIGFINTMCILLGAPLLQPLIGIVLAEIGEPTIVGGVEQYSLADFQITLLCFPIFFACTLLMIAGMRKDTTHV